MGTMTNEPGWSHSRRELFESCLRAYYFHYFRSWRGWERDVDPLTREAYRLKKLDDRWSWMGGITHHIISQALLGAKAGLVPDAAERVETAHQISRAEWTKSRGGDRSRKNERGFWGLLEHEYSEDVGPDGWQYLWIRTRAGLRWFFGQPWADIALGFQREQWVSVDDGDLNKAWVMVDGLKLWAMPDFAFIDGDGALHIVDWKTGRPKPQHADQLAGYGLAAAVRNGGQLPGNGELRVSLVYLTEEKTETVTIGSQDLEAFRGRMTASAAEMRALLADPEKNAPLPMEAFRMTDELDQCRRCAFRRLCDRE